MALEGVRGLAAIVVVLHHFLLAFYPFLIFGPGQPQHMRFEDNIFGTPLALPLAGTFAVAIFFVLSGFVLSIGFFQTKSDSVIKKLATKRYVRLMLPALAATLIAFILIKVGFSEVVAKGASITQSEWLGGSWQFDASFLNALYSGTIGIFIEGQSYYDNVLWTMMTEFAGSFIVFGFVLLFGASKHRWVSYLILGGITFNTWFLPFVIGMAMADLHVQGKFTSLMKKPWLTTGLFAGVLFFGAYPYQNADSTIYRFLNIDVFSQFGLNYQMFYLTIGATLLITGILISNRIAAWLERPKVSVLGRYTFSLYLIHVPLLFSVVMLSFIIIEPHLGYNLAVLCALLIAVPTFWAGTILFEKYIDAPSIRFSKYLAEVFEGREKIEIRKFTLNLKNRIRVLTRVNPEQPEVDESPID